MKFRACTVQYTKTASFYIAEIVRTERSLETWNIFKCIGPVALHLPSL